MLLVATLHIAFASNADNYFCVGCGVLMETVHHTLVERTAKLAATAAAGIKEEVDINVHQMVMDACDAPAVRKLNEVTITTCKEVVSSNAAFIASMFAGESPTPSNFYKRAHHACVEKLDLCDKPKKKDMRRVARNVCL